MCAVLRKSLPGIALSLLILLFAMGTASVFTAMAAEEGNAPKIDSNLEKAIKSGKKTIYFSGTERDNLTIPSGVTVIGTGPDKAVINADIRLGDGASLMNATVNGKLTSVTVMRGASATLDNVTVRGGKDIGIYAPEGGGTLAVKNSRILDNRKGFYIMPGKTVVFTGNQVMRNKEEGIDMRSGISGTISGNRVFDNGEGGAELIIGGSSVSLTGNTFEGNGASGLALQIYDGTAQDGNVTVAQNAFSSNGNFGVDCKKPSGGKASFSSFHTSVVSQGNVFQGNGRGSINRACGM